MSSDNIFLEQRARNLTDKQWAELTAKQEKKKKKL